MPTSSEATRGVELVVATRNPGKMREIRAILANLPITILSAEEAGVPDVHETGATFEENARLKATAACTATGKMALGEDSGIEIDALGGRPGVLSSRFAGPRATDEDRNREILRQLAGVPPRQRTARYRAVAALALPDGRVFTAEGRCEGLIAERPAGEGGFGYDPIFYYPPYGCTMAQVPAEKKNAVSHRAKALAGIADILIALLAEEQAA